MMANKAKEKPPAKQKFKPVHKIQEADDALFSTILSNRSHVLYTSEHPEIAYSLRTKNHNKFLVPKTSDLRDRHFIIRSLYKNLY